jgi:hypothetical protein
MSRSIGRNLVWLVWFLLGIVVAIGGYFVWTWFWSWAFGAGIFSFHGTKTETEIDWPKASVAWMKIATLVFILFGGAAGGFIYSLIQVKGLQLPQTVESRVKLDDERSVIHKIIDLGWLGDMVIGIGGGILIFLVLPSFSEGTASNIGNVINTGNEISYLVRVVATSMIGGFASRSIFDEASKTFKKKLEGLSDKVDGQIIEISSLGQNVTNIDNSINNIDQSNRLDSIVRQLLPRQLDPSLKAVEGEEWKQLSDALICSSSSTKRRVFEEVRKTIDDHWITKLHFTVFSSEGLPEDLKEDSLDPSVIDQRIDVLKQASAILPLLVQSAVTDQQQAENMDDDQHRYLAHIAFCQEQIESGKKLNKPEYACNWQSPREYIEQAINKRNMLDSNAKEEFWHYDLHQLFYLSELRVPNIEANRKVILAIYSSKNKALKFSILSAFNINFAKWFLTGQMAETTPPATSPNQGISITPPVTNLNQDGSNNTAPPQDARDGAHQVRGDLKA